MKWDRTKPVHMNAVACPYYHPKSEKQYHYGWKLYCTFIRLQQEHSMKTNQGKPWITKMNFQKNFKSSQSPASVFMPIIFSLQLVGFMCIPITIHQSIEGRQNTTGWQWTKHQHHVDLEHIAE